MELLVTLAAVKACMGVVAAALPGVVKKDQRVGIPSRPAVPFNVSNISVVRAFDTVDRTAKNVETGGIVHLRARNL